ncbi:MAG: DUF1800 domain-containing protein [Pseudomonadota bacterium]
MTELALQDAEAQTPTRPSHDDETTAPAAYALGLAALGSLTLAACGGGGSGSSDVGPTAAKLPLPTQAQAARFASIAGTGATQADIDALTGRGYEAWLDAQFNAPRSLSHFDWLLAKGYGVAADQYSFNGMDATIWRKLLSSPDVLRQRVVLALSEIFVVSMTGLSTSWGKFALAAYLDMLEERAFGSYRDLLGAFSLSCAMGVYLNMRGNQKGDPKTGRQPDENYAREVMQLFSIGLLQLNPDGSPKTLADGRTQYTYNQEHVTALAQVFTGWDFNTTNVNAGPAFMREPMRHIAARFATGDKSVLGVAIPASADGPTALNKALDVLAAHDNVGPFIGRQLIQRLVCSQPSPAYVARVSAVFANNGQGQRGDLKAVIRAILLDPEAINPPAGPASGKLREPVLRLVQWARTFGVTSPSDAWAVGDTSNPSSRLGQSPLRSPSVFNFFRPGYLPPDSALGSNAVTAPEFQLCNETTVAGYLNFMQSVIQNGIGDLKPDYTAYYALANDAAALVSRFNLLLAGGRLGADTQAAIASAVGSIAATTDSGRLNRVRATILLVMAAPEYLIQI